MICSRISEHLTNANGVVESLAEWERAHVAECEECSRFAAAQRELDEMLRDALSAEARVDARWRAGVLDLTGDALPWWRHAAPEWLTLAGVGASIAGLWFAGPVWVEPLSWLAEHVSAGGLSAGVGVTALAAAATCLWATRLSPLEADI